MKVSIVSHSYTAEENRKNIAALAERARLSVVLPYTSEDKLFDIVRFSGAGSNGKAYRPYHRLSLFGAQYLLLTGDMHFRSFAPDLIHLEYDPWSAIFWQVLACRNVFAPRARLVCTVKNNTYRRYPGLRGTLKDGIARGGVRRVDHFIAVSEMVAELYRSIFDVGASRISVMHHLGVDTSLFTPSAGPAHEAGGMRVGYCGRLDEDKGVLELFEAARACREAGASELTLDYLGNGKLRERLAALAVEHDWFRLLPPVPHARVPAFLQGLDLFVLPSCTSTDKEEHDAHALLEALAVGVPCLGTHSGITPEILGDGTGLLVEPNSADALSRGLLRLFRCSELRQTLGFRGRAKALSTFSVEALADQRARIYQEILDAR